MFKRSITVLVVLVMITSMVAPFAGTVGAQQSGAPSGMVGVPSENVGPPDHAQGGGNGGGPPGGVELPESVPTDAAAWSVHASKHAGDLGVTIGEISGSPALVFSDDVNHDGREVAVDATTLEETLGERPPTAYGLHEDGSEWTSSISYENGMAVFEVPRFSSNTVTFEGTISLTGSPAENGTTYTYDLSDSEDISDINVTLTGSENRMTQTVSDTNVPDGGSVSVNVDGTMAPSAESVSIEGDWVQWREGLSQNIHSTAFDESTGTLIVGLADGTVHAFDVTDGTNIWTNVGHSNWVTGIAIDSSTGTVYTASRDEEVHAINMSDGTDEWTYTGHSFEVFDVAVDSSADTVYTASRDNEVHALDADPAQSTPTQKWTYTGHSSDVWGVAVDSSTGTVYSGSGDEELHAINGTEGTRTWNYTKHTGSVEAVAVDESAGTVYTGSEDTQIHAVDGDPSQSSPTQQWTYTGFSDEIHNIAVDESAGRVYSGEVGVSDPKVRALDGSTGSLIWSHNGSGYIRNGNAISVDESTGTVNLGIGEDALRLQPTEDPSVSIDGNTVSYSGFLSDGETFSESVSLSLGDHSASVSTADGEVAPSVEYDEITETIDPALVVNGDRYDEFGTLADGETASLDVSEASLSNGTNTVDVVVSESYDGPTGQVGLNYTHAATTDQDVDYGSEAYSERYNASKTFAADQEDATLTVPFASTVVDVRNLETRTNGGEWSTISSSNYELENSSLAVDLGNVAAEDTVEVRTTATKVRVTDGSITVTDPTILGESLATEIRLEEKGSDFAIGVSSTAYDDELHYTYSESWSNAQSHAHVENDGSQELRLPNAGAGATTRIGTIDLGVTPESGAADVRVTETGTEPEFVVRESSTAESIDFEWRETTSGHVYQLYSQTADGEVDRGEASSPVTLTYSGSGGETLAIFDLGTGGTNAGGGGGGGVTSSSTSPILLILAIVGGLAGLYLVSRRTGDESISGMALFAVGAVVMGILGMQALAPRILADWIGRGISEALPLVLLAGAAIAIVWLRQRGNDTNLTFRLGGNR